MKIVITGARGRLKRVLRSYFAGAGDRGSGFLEESRRCTPPLRDLPALLVRGDVDIVLHLAWSMVPATAEQMLGVEQQEDLPLLSSLLSSLATSSAHGVQPLLFLFSTCAVYAEPQSGQAFTEDNALAPKGRYAAGKVAVEMLIKEFRAAHGMDVCILLVTNPYGFSQGADCKQGVIPAMLAAAESNAEFTAWGSGDAIKDYLHIEDLCAAVDYAVRKKLNGTFNVAAGVSHSLDRVTATVEAASGRSLKIRHTEPRLWDVRNGRYSNEAFVRATGWFPRVDLEEGIKRFVGGDGRYELAQCGWRIC